MVTMENNVKFLIVLLCGVFSLGAYAQNNHWSYDAYAYQYDMTVYVALNIDGVTASAYSDYEIAAFCGDECRGIAEIQNAGNGSSETAYGYLRIRSNQPSGETIIFKVYKKSIAKEMEIDNTNIVFQSQQLVGLPSNPLLLDLPPQGNKGDVNMDNVIDVTDVVLIIDDILGKNPNNYNNALADVNGDGEINITDVVFVIDFILGKISLGN